MATIEVWQPPSQQLDTAQLLLLRGNGFHISATLSHVTSNSVVSLECLGRILAQMWEQLDLIPALSIYSRTPPAPSVIHLALSRAIGNSVEALLPTLLPHAFIPRLCVNFLFSGEGRPTRRTVIGLVDQGLRGIWGKDLAEAAPVLGTPGLVKKWQSRGDEVDVIAGVLAGSPCSENSEGKKEVEERVKAQLWACVLHHVHTGEKLEMMVWDGASMWQEEEEGGDMLLDDSGDYSWQFWVSDEGSKEGEEDEVCRLWDTDDDVAGWDTPPEVEQQGPLVGAGPYSLLTGKAAEDMFREALMRANDADESQPIHG